ncbi:PA14 domain-containing protein [Streptomyces sp. NPDC008238]
MDHISRRTACGAVMCPKGDSVSSVGRSRLATGTAMVVALTGGLVAGAASPAGAATSCATNTYTRQFFANTTFSGKAKRTDCDSAISENWGGNSPGVSGVGKDNFGVRWQMTRDFGSGGPFAFTASGQDGIRVYLDGVREIDLWKNGTTTVSKTVNLTIPKGTHTLRIDYVNWTGSAAVKFAYTPRTGAAVDQVAPLTPTGLSIARDAGAKRNVLRWSANKEMDVAGYRVYRRTPGQTSFGNPIATVTGTIFTDTTAGTTTHLYEVRAFDKSGNTSAGTADVSVTGNPMFLRQYFANTALTGTPKRTDIDSAISENWGGNSPGVSGVGKDNFGVRWQMTRDFGSGGPFAFTASGQDGIRVYLDGAREIDLWKNGTTTVSKTVNLTIPKGTHALRIDYVNWTGSAAVKFAYTPHTPPTVDKTAPLAPVGVKATFSPSTGKSTITWAKSPEMDLAGYRVYRTRGYTGTWTRVSGTNAVTTTSYSDTPPPGPDRYAYAVTAVDRAGHASAIPSPSAWITWVDTKAPAAPKGVEDNWDIGLTKEVQLNWDSNTEQDLAGYRVYRSTETPVALTRDNLVSGDATVLNSPWYEETPPATGDWYHYVVTAVDKLGLESPPSRTATFQTWNKTAPVFVATDLKATDGEHAVTLTWSWNRDLKDLAGFQVYRDGVPIDVASGYYEDTEVQRSMTHSYQVRAYDETGNLGRVSAAVVVAHGGDYTAPGAVTGLKATAVENGVSLDWDDSTAVDFDHYEVFRGTHSDGQWSYTDVTDELSFGRIWSDNLHRTLPDGEQVRYAVVAVDKDGNALDASSEEAAGVDVTELDMTPTVGTPDGAPFSFLETEDQRLAHVELRWGYDPERDEHGAAIGFHIYRWDRAAGTYTRLTDTLLAPNTWSYTDVTSPLGSTLYYRMTAVYEDGTESVPIGDYTLT